MPLWEFNARDYSWWQKWPGALRTAYIGISEGRGGVYIKTLGRIMNIIEMWISPYTIS